MTTTRRLIELSIANRSEGRCVAHYYHMDTLHPGYLSIEEIEVDSEDDALFETLSRIEARHGRILSLDAEAAEGAGRV